MFRRYTVFYTPPPGPLAAFGASWLGWDSRDGRSVAHPGMGGLDVARLTETPRRYGFHATLKPPFRLADDAGETDLLEAVAELASRLAGVGLAPLAAVHRHGFVALRPVAGSAPDTRLGQLAGSVVRDLDRFRAPPTEAELARRRAARLTARQEANLVRWGYPFVLEDFHFHMTLTGRIDSAMAVEVLAALQPMLERTLPSEPKLEALSVLGEGQDGFFLEIGRFTLAAGSS